MGVISNGTTLLDAGSLDSGVAVGKLTHIKTLTASSSANLTFTHGSSDVVFDSTYKAYVFKFIEIHPQTDTQAFGFNASTNNSDYNVNKHTTFYRAQHLENDAGTAFEYVTDDDLANGTGEAKISNLCGNDADQNISGEMWVFEPSSTTFVKHVKSVVDSCFTDSEASANLFMAGYINTTSAVTSIRFQFASGNIDSGSIKLYGIA